MADDALDARLEEAGDLIKRSAQAHALAQGLHRAAASLEIGVSGDAVTVTANPGIAPMARAFELGLRHPLNYPHQNGWGNTPHRPFLAPAAVDELGACAEAISEVVIDYGKIAGFE